MRLLDSVFPVPDIIWGQWFLSIEWMNASSKSIRWKVSENEKNFKSFRRIFCWLAWLLHYFVLLLHVSTLLLPCFPNIEWNSVGPQMWNSNEDKHARTRQPTMSISLFPHLHLAWLTGSSMSNLVSALRSNSGRSLVVKSVVSSGKCPWIFYDLANTGSTGALFFRYPTFPACYCSPGYCATRLKVVLSPLNSRLP